MNDIIMSLVIITQTLLCRAEELMVIPPPFMPYERLSRKISLEFKLQDMQDSLHVLTYVGFLDGGLME